MMKLYRGYNDYELLYLIKNRNEDAWSIMFDKYTNFISIKIAQHKIPRNDYDDFMQEGLILLNEAIYSFNELYDCSFYNYFNLLIDRKFIRLMQKHYKHHNTLNYLLANSKETTTDALEDLIVADLIYQTKAALTTDLEKKIYQEILLDQISVDVFCEKYNYPVRKIYNALYQLRKKCLARIQKIQN